MTHGLGVPAPEVDEVLRDDLELRQGGSWVLYPEEMAIPTSRLVGRALTAVESVVAAVDYALVVAAQREHS